MTWVEGWILQNKIHETDHNEQNFYADNQTRKGYVKLIFGMCSILDERGFRKKYNQQVKLQTRPLNLLLCLRAWQLRPPPSMHIKNSWYWSYIIQQAYKWYYTAKLELAIDSSVITGVICRRRGSRSLLGWSCRYSRLRITRLGKCLSWISLRISSISRTLRN